MADLPQDSGSASHQERTEPPMDAERQNQTETRLEDLAHRLKDLRGYL
jgi:hypothetical protein